MKKIITLIIFTLLILLEYSKKLYAKHFTAIFKL